MKNRDSNQNADQYWVRQHNLAIILQKIWNARSPISRPELTQRSGLNKMTISNLVAELEEMLYVRPVGTYQPPKSGRPGSLYEINPEGGLILGIEIDIGIIQAIICDFSGKILWRTTENVVFETGDVFQQAENVVSTALSAAKTFKPEILGIGVAIAALVSKEGESMLLPGTLDPFLFKISSNWEEKFQLPVFVTNDGNASAIGQQILSKVDLDEDFIFINAGEGLGAGIISNGEIFLGAGGFAGEVGHITIDFNGIPCKCGNRGCLENYVSLNAALENWKAHPLFNSSQYGEHLSGIINQDYPILCGAAQAGDQAAKNVLDQIGHYFGIGLASLINTFNPRFIFLGGSFCAGSDHFMPSLLEEVNHRCFEMIRKNLKTVGVVGNPLDSSVLGAASLVIKDILNKPWRLNSNGNPGRRHLGY